MLVMVMLVVLEVGVAIGRRRGVDGLIGRHRLDWRGRDLLLRERVMRLDLCVVMQRRVLVCVALELVVLVAGNDAGAQRDCVACLVWLRHQADWRGAD